MNQRLTPKEAFKAMVIFLEKYHERGNYSDTLQNVLDDISQTFWVDTPNDPAQWEDWLEAVDSIIKNKQ